MKRILAFLCAALMAVSLGACGKSNTGSSEGKFVRYDAPEGYEIYESADTGAAYVIYGADGEIGQSVSINYWQADDDFKKAMKSKKTDVFADTMEAVFEDNLKPEFTKVGDVSVLRIDDMQDGGLVEITYYLLAGDWGVLVVVSDGNLAEADKDAQAMIKSIRLEELAFKS